MPDFMTLVPIGGLGKAINLGGPVVGILLVLSVIALAVILYKAWYFVRLGRSSRQSLETALIKWHHGESAVAYGLVTRQGGPAAAIIKSAMLALMDGVDRDLLREDVRRVATRQLDEMRSGLRPLEVIAQLAPLLGLFGTVLGMIEAFRQLQEAGTQVDPAVLAGGIWVALLTTAAGLAVAMPVSVALSFLESRIACEHSVMEDVFTALFTGAPAELLVAGAVETEPQQTASLANA